MQVNYADTQERKEKKMNTLIIVRGLPGSGKSTFAKTFDLPIFEADQYFLRFKKNENFPKYHFQREKIQDAHNICFENVKNCLSLGISCVVANTFCRFWEFEKYLKMTKKNIVYKCIGDFENVHAVSQQIIQGMTETFEDYKGEILVSETFKNKKILIPIL